MIVGDGQRQNKLLGLLARQLLMLLLKLMGAAASMFSG